MDDLISKQTIDGRSDNTLAGGGEMGRLMRTQEWQESPFGAVEQWPQSLRTAVSMCLASRFPIILFWGKDLRQFYNDAYRPILGQSKHPCALGQRAQECWPEIWDVIGPMLDGVVMTGEATWSENQLLLLDRNGYVEECYFTFSYSPIRDESGEVGGVFCAVTETTAEVLNERRLRALRALATNTAQAKSVEEAYQITVETLTQYADDVPFSLLYNLDVSGSLVTLAGTTGISTGTIASAHTIALAAPDAVWPFSETIVSGEPYLLAGLAQHFGEIWNTFFQADQPAPDNALILPITRAGEALPYGFLVAGINTRRRVDNEYRGFLSLLAGQIAATIATARAYQEAQERAEALAELDRAKTAFFSNISHEFRTPLTLLLGPLEAVLADPQHSLDDEYRTQLEMAHRNGLRQLKLVNTLLDFSRIEAGRMQAAYTPTDLADITLDLASVFRSAIEAAHLRFVVDCPPLSEPVYVDREMWEKIVLNLLSNAFKFTFEGEIRVILQMVNDTVLLSIADTGIGIRAEDLPHLFERFYQAKAQRSRAQEGSGIGLSLVQELVRLHGGSIEVSSMVGKGTTFTVRLPRGNAHLPPAQVRTTPTLSSTVIGVASYVEEARRLLLDTQTYAGVSEAEDLPQDFSASNQTSGFSENSTARVLIVDDNPDMREYLVHLLSPFYTLRIASDGYAALEIVHSWYPDLILSDIMMPGMNGFELLSAVRADPLFYAIPIIFLSARAGEEATIEGLQVGADDYLVKPFSARELLARVKARLEITRLSREISALLERERAALAEAEIARQHLYDLFMQAPAFICVLRGPQHVFELANPLSLQLMGHRHLLGLPARQVLLEFEGQGLFELLDRVYTTGEPFIGNEVRILIDRKNDGQLEEGYFNFVYQASRTTQGEVDGVLIHAVEVTELVRARQRVDTFLGIASHELKSPLTSIKGNVQLAIRRVSKTIKENLDNQELQKLLGEVQTMLERGVRQIDFLNRLVGDLVDVARIQAEKLELRIAPADLNIIVRDTVEEQRYLAPQRIIRLILSDDETSPPTLEVDADRISQVVMNYLSNALKYSETEKVIVVTVSHIGALMRVAVTDEGPGLAVEKQMRVWDRFYRAPGVAIKSGSGVGLGLGLYICRTIIEQHGGQVGVESIEGQGSTFWFTLPIAGNLGDDAKKD